VTPKRLLRLLRHAVMVLVLAGAVYLLVRFDGMRLGLDSPSPLLRFSPGDSLLVDRYPEGMQVDDSVFYVGPDGREHLGFILERRQVEGVTQFWLGHDAPDAVAPDSQTLGWVDGEWIAGRVIMVWPW